MHRKKLLQWGGLAFFKGRGLSTLEGDSGKFEKISRRSKRLSKSVRALDEADQCVLETGLVKGANVVGNFTHILSKCNRKARRCL